MVAACFVPTLPLVSLEYLVGGVVSLVLLGYLVYALVFPERF